MVVSKVLQWQSLDLKLLQSPLWLGSGPNFDSQWFLYWPAQSKKQQRSNFKFQQKQQTLQSNKVLLTLSRYKPRTTSAIRFSSTGSPCVLTTHPGSGGKFDAAKSNLGGETLTSVNGTGLWNVQNTMLTSDHYAILQYVLLQVSRRVLCLLPGKYMAADSVKLNDVFGINIGSWEWFTIIKYHQSSMKSGHTSVERMKLVYCM